MIFSRSWSMPSPDTFDCPPIKAFVQRYLARSKVSVDPFARNKRWATCTNDLNPNTLAQEHLDAEVFLVGLANRGLKFDLGLFDPPYSPRQISECYKSFGREVTSEDTQNSRLYKRTRDALSLIISEGGIVLSFGWNSSGMGCNRGFEQIELLLVCHGGAHNDTICLAEKRVPEKQTQLKI